MRIYIILHKITREINRHIFRLHCLFNVYKCYIHIKHITLESYSMESPVRQETGKQAEIDLYGFGIG